MRGVYTYEEKVGNPLVMQPRRHEEGAATGGFQYLYCVRPELQSSPFLSNNEPKNFPKRTKAFFIS